jgi:hypothetical protein
MLGQKASDLVHQSSSVGNQALTDAVYGLQSQLIG